MRKVKGVDEPTVVVSLAALVKAGAWSTDMVPDVPVIEEFTVSVAVTVRNPPVTSVT